MNCAHCNSADTLAHGKRNALYPLGLVAIFGLPFALLHQVSALSDYHCHDCGADFARRTLTSRIAWVCLLSCLAILAATFVVFIIIAVVTAMSLSMR